MTDEIAREFKTVYDQIAEVKKQMDDFTCMKVDEVTPYTTSATAYIGDTAVEFRNVPDGNMTVYVKDKNGCPDYTVAKEGSTVIVSFEPIENVTEVTLSII